MRPPNTHSAFFSTPYLQVDLFEVPGAGQGAAPGVQVTHAFPGQEGRTGEVVIDL